MREVYLQGARDQLGGIAELAERLITAGDDIDAVDQLRREAHKIHGSAGSFGFTQATAVAAELEEAAKQWLAQPGQGVSTRGAAARAFVRRLAAALFTKQAAPPAPPAPPAPVPPAAVPATPAAPVPPAPRTSPSPPPAATPAPDPEDVPEIVVVEDDAAVAERLVFGIEARGYRFALYRTGAEALAYLRSLDTLGTAPLLLLDVDGPAIDGYSILETLQRECPAKFRVVLTTEHGDKRKQRRGREAGALDYLVMGTSLWVALESIRGWVGR
jgi:CheY-like chemotaxis protein/HPt (histidine-containing phosphotransfer) domain-containing protein